VTTKQTEKQKRDAERLKYLEARYKREQDCLRGGDRFPPCDNCNDGAWMTFPFKCSCGRK